MDHSNESNTNRVRHTVEFFQRIGASKTKKLNSRPDASEQKGNWFLYDLPNGRGLLRIRSQKSSSLPDSTPADTETTTEGLTSSDPKTLTALQLRFQRHKMYFTEEKRCLDTNNCADENHDESEPIVG